MVVHGDQIYMNFIRFLICEDLQLYTWCLRYNICSTWFLDIRISTCSITTHYPLSPYIRMYAWVTHHNESSKSTKFSNQLSQTVLMCGVSASPEIHSSIYQITIFVTCLFSQN